VTIEFRTTGGVAYLPGLAAPVTIDTAELQPERKTKLDRLVAESRFFDQPAEAPLPSRGADYQVYTITVREGDRTHTVRVAEPIADAALAALVEALRQLRNEKVQAKRQSKPNSVP
jgi:Emfourin